jgi:putative hemolysin
MWLMIHYVMKPLTLLIDTLQEIVLRMIGHKVEEEEEEHEQKILDSVDEGEKAGVFEDAERKMIENLIEFKDRDAGEVMTPRTEMIAISVDEGVKKVVEAMKESKLSRILIYKENRDNIIGFVHVRDLLPYWDHTEPLPHLNVLMHDPYLVPVSKSIRSLFQEFKDQHLHIAVVLDEYGGTAGLISLEDILEEIVGEIVDEHEDEEEMMYKVIGSGEIIVNARLRIDELNEVFETEIEENEQFDSVGGLLISQLGRIPTEGEQGELAELNLFYKISKANERKIDEVVFKKLEEKIES